MQNELPELKPGDRVKWTHTRATKSGFSFSTRTGKVVGVSGDFVGVTGRAGTQTIHRSNLRLEGQRSELTEQIIKLGESLGIDYGKQGE